MTGIPTSMFLTTLTLTLATGPQSATADRPIATGFLYKTLEYEGETHAYCVYVPPNYNPDKAWPLILFLHGSGERGRDGFRQTDVGLGTALRRWHRSIPAIVVMPQCPAKQVWTGPAGLMALRCVEAASREYHCDADRVYLTGLSLGGHGTWHIAASLPDKFAAIVPICGFAELGEDTGLARKLARRLKDVPVWCFHGVLDGRVPVDKSRELVMALKRFGGNVQYTEYPDLEHNCWDRAYATRAMWDWLFEQRRGQRASSQPTPGSPNRP
jgi:predicted peptidase